MGISFENSETKENLMRAFAGECQARMRYDLAAAKAKEEQLPVIEAIFKFTSNQESEHAEIFYRFLHDFSGETIQVDGTYPVDLSDKIIDLLRAAQHNEYEEHDTVYKAFGDKANEEGFSRIGAVFHQIAEIEKTHAERFEKFADLLERGMLFVSEVETGWMCLNCGYIHVGREVPGKCPVCQHEKGYFIRIELAPYTC
ncbi:rubrerythrin [Anaeromicropila populeti]|uniref:Rubrerythrin n=1 Tax=Anaeromicropila populeti TaxID=37658 RepID=A0A1I6KPU9_9FIRM|nr:rubrerythrin family protein [Anaeromicropila populeti]SFR93265.1 Rubrerythrin [Anaeromicropila populeti]